MKVITMRLPEDVENKIRIKARLEHRSVSEQIKKYICDAIVCEDNPDIPLRFIKETLEAKAEIEVGLGTEYKFGIIK
ncbi:MAG: Arc family DNA-binding protein [Candidatus Anammoxibacter sp.]